MEGSQQGACDQFAHFGESVIIPGGIATPTRPAGHATPRSVIIPGGIATSTGTHLTSRSRGRSVIIPGGIATQSPSPANTRFPHALHPPWRSPHPYLPPLLPPL